jgi:hypothetical protein
LSDIFQKHLCVVKRAGVIPFVVFDGLLLNAGEGEKVFLLKYYKIVQEHKKLHIYDKQTCVNTRIAKYILVELEKNVCSRLKVKI